MSKLKFYLIGLLLITSPYSLFAQTWCPPMRVSQYDTSINLYVITGQGLTTDSTGTPWCGWVVGDCSGPVYNCLLVSHYNGTWSNPDTIHPFSFFYNCNLATDANGNIWVVAEDIGISACFYNGSLWSNLMQVPVASCSHYPVATGDTLGNLWVCWAGGGPGDGHHVWGNTYIEGQWGPPVLISYPGSPEDFSYSMTTDKQGRVWVGWYRFSCPDPAICASFNDGAGWSDTMVIAGYSTPPCGPALTVDTSGKLWAGWRNPGVSGYNISASYYDGDSWVEPMLVSSEVVGWEWQIAITSDDKGMVWLTWTNPDTNIYYSYWNGSNWSSPEPIDTNPARDSDPKMTFDGERIWVTWIKETGPDLYDLYASYTYGLEVEEEPTANPLLVLGLSQNFPNPFSSKTIISYQLLSDGYVSLRIYNITGELVRTLMNKNQNAGHHAVSWDGKDEKGEIVPSGIYFYYINAGNFINAKRMLLIR